MTSFGGQVDFSLGIYPTYQHLHIFRTSQHLQRRHLHSPASPVLGDTLAAWVWVIWLGREEGAARLACRLTCPVYSSANVVQFLQKKLGASSWTWGSTVLSTLFRGSPIVRTEPQASLWGSLVP